MTTPDLHLTTLFVLNDDGRISATREPSPSPAPKFCLVRGTTTCVWAIGEGVPDDIAAEVAALARDELPGLGFHTPPRHAVRYVALLGERVSSGLAFSFPDKLPDPGDIALIDDVRPLQQHFSGWSADEIPSRSPIVAILEGDDAVSVCFGARRSKVAAEAGLETAEAFRGRGFGSRVTAAWAQAIRASRRTPLYSTSWDNDASLAVARKLKLHEYASNWSVRD